MVIAPYPHSPHSGGAPAPPAADARARQVKEAAQWPYEWVAGVDYAPRAQRTTVTGRLELVDPYAKSKTLPNLLVGLTPATWTSPVPRTGPGGVALPPRQIDWQIDARHYQFWARGEENGAFSIPNVPAGTYTLRALADGVLGEFAQADVVVKPGQPLDLGSLARKPVRHGKPLWEVGIPNRTASEFAGADQFWSPEMPLKYATMFPNDVNFVIGKSDPARDWFFQHVPHNENPAAKSIPFRGVTTPGRATPFNISFDLPASPAPRGKATLRIAICGGGARELTVTVNGQPAGKIDRLLADGAITRHSIRGLWYERDVPFDAALLKPGPNTLTLTVPAGPVNSGVIYDYLRLELDDNP
jgi:rhamnogalacturonan endolyase